MGQSTDRTLFPRRPYSRVWIPDGIWEFVLETRHIPRSKLWPESCRCYIE